MRIPKRLFYQQIPPLDKFAPTGFYLRFARRKLILIWKCQIGVSYHLFQTLKREDLNFARGVSRFVRMDEGRLHWIQSFGLQIVRCRSSSLDSLRERTLDYDRN